MEQNIFNFFILLVVLYIIHYLINSTLDKLENTVSTRALTTKDCSDKALNDSYTHYIFGTPLSKLTK